MTWRAYEPNLEDNLRDLHARVHRGGYRAKPSRRVYIPKADGRQRPLGIAALEDKIVQRAVVEVLNAIYEEDFLGFSYGFRPRRSQHDALDALAVGIYRKKANWMLDCDVADFFTRIDHPWLERFLEARVENRASAGGRLDDPTDDGRLALAAALSCRSEAGDQRGITPRADELARPVPRRDRTRDGKDA